MNSRQHESSVQTMTVDIRLCGNIPRRDMKQHFSGAQRSLLALASQRGAPMTTDCSTENNASDNDGSSHRTISLCDNISKVLQNQSNFRAQETPSTVPIIEPPSWAVPARGETRLEVCPPFVGKYLLMGLLSNIVLCFFHQQPVCDSLGRQCPVDLTRRAAFRVGRSPNSDVQLMHATSSRKHAMLFHHANGSCYVIDCGSAHGTFVNGVRVSSLAKGGRVVPHKVRRGALIRFGGPGAPCFVLKSFSFQLRDIMNSNTDKSDRGELIVRNTRINALGKTASEVLGDRVFATLQEAVAVSRKRSYDSLDSRETLDEDPCCKRRCMSPPTSPEQMPVRFVSPDLPPVSLISHRHVTFSKDPPQAFYPALVTPDDLSSEEDN